MLYFYPRSPCGERRSNIVITSQYSMYFYPRSPCGERPDGLFFLSRRKRFLSTLSLRRATYQELAPSGAPTFLSTLSLRRATRNSQNIKRRHNISIHALLAESDAASITPATSRRNFYPRSPCGERPPPNNLIIQCQKFLSTLSLRRATESRSNILKTS